MRAATEGYECVQASLGWQLLIVTGWFLDRRQRHKGNKFSDADDPEASDVIPIDEACSNLNVPSARSLSSAAI